MFRNPDIPFTYNYSQPSEYRFSIDSIEMPWEVAQYLKGRLSANEIAYEQIEKWNCLDLCAGCGVLGFELNFHIPQLHKIDFVEIQSQYESHFLENKSKVEQHLATHFPSINPEFKFLDSNYDKILLPEFENRYQLILCNPPYFFPEQGKISESDFRSRCRFFIDSTFEKLIQTIDFCLAMEGEAFILIRDQEDHARDLFVELRKLIKGTLQCENLCLIRGTCLLRLYR